MALSGVRNSWLKGKELTLRAVRRLPPRRAPRSSSSIATRSEISIAVATYRNVPSSWTNNLTITSDGSFRHPDAQRRLNTWRPSAGTFRRRGERGAVVRVSVRAEPALDADDLARTVSERLLGARAHVLELIRTDPPDEDDPRVRLEDPVHECQRLRKLVLEADALGDVRA
jgi:hypothetical protein